MLRNLKQLTKSVMAAKGAWTVVGRTQDEQILMHCLLLICFFKYVDILQYIQRPIT